MSKTFRRIARKILPPLPEEQAPNPIAGFGPLAHQVPLADIVDDCYILTDGTLVAVYKVHPFEATTADDATVGDWDRSLQSLINAMQPGLQLKVLYRQHHNYRDIIDEFRRQGKGTNAFSRLVQEDEADMWRLIMEAKQLIRTEVVVALSFKPSRTMFRPGMPLSEIAMSLIPKGDKGGPRRTRKQHQAAIDELDRATSAVVQSMQISGLQPERLNDDDLARLAYELLNPSRALKIPAPSFTADGIKGPNAAPKLSRPSASDPMHGRFAGKNGASLLMRNRGFRVLTPYSVREQLCHADWRVTENFVETDGLYVGIVSMRLLPEVTHAGMILNLLHLPFQMSVTVDAYMLKKQKESEQAWKDARMRESAAKATLLPTTTADPMQAEVANEAKQHYLEMASAHQNPVRTRVLVTVYADDPRTLDERCTLVLQTMRMMNSMTGTRERFAVDTLIKTSWPFGLVTDINSRKTLTKHASAMLPMFGSWEGASRPRALFRDPSMRLVKHDPFNVDLANKNKIVVGRSGSGKSFATQMVDLLPMLAAGAEVMGVDNGASFLVTTKVTGGRFLRVGPRSEFVYNIFDLPRGFLDSTATTPEGLASEKKSREAVIAFKVATIADLVLTMAGVEDLRQQKRVTAILADVVSRLYDRLLKDVEAGRRTLDVNQMPRLRDLHKLLGEYDNPDDASATELIRQVHTDIRRYVVWEGADGTVHNGPYAGVLDVHTNFDVNSQMTIFEFGEVSDTKDLMNPLALVFISGLMYNRMMARDGVERYVVLDEAWKLLEHPAARAAITRFYREARKMNGAVTLITQSFADLDNEIGRPLMENATTTYFLRHQKNNANDAALTKSGVNDRRREAIFELQQVKGEFSEVMLKLDDSWGVVRLEPTPLKYWMATTDPPDIEMRERYLKLYHEHWGLSWAQTLVILAHDYPRGVVSDKGSTTKLSEYAALALAERFQLRLTEMEGRIRHEITKAS